MTGALQSGSPDQSCPVLQPEQAAIWRAEQPRLTDAIVSEIRHQVPGYGPPDGSPGLLLRLCVSHLLAAFTERIAGPPSPDQPGNDARDEICRRLGEHEALEGRGLAGLQAAYRAGAQRAWGQVIELGSRNRLPAAVTSGLADAVLRYADELTALSTQGYRSAQRGVTQSPQAWRQRLLSQILEQPPGSGDAITELARRAGWPLPPLVTPVAIEPPAPAAVPLPGAAALGSLDGQRPHLLVPGYWDEARHAALEVALRGRRAAIGVTVPLAEAADSIRWARQALALRRAGVIAAGRLLRCEDHLLPICLTESGLLAHLARRQLAGLDGLSRLRRHRLTDTLGAWLGEAGKATDVAERLGVHPQTVRYRIRVLRQVLGGQLDDPDARFALELALRARRLRDRLAATPSSPRGRTG